MTIKAHKVETIVKKVLTKVFPRIIITSCKSYDEEGRDHFASQRAGALLKAASEPVHRIRKSESAFREVTKTELE